MVAGRVADCRLDVPEAPSHMAVCGGVIAAAAAALMAAPCRIGAALAERESEGVRFRK